MKYIIWFFAFGSGIMALTILGEYLAEHLPETHWFAKWWRGSIVGEDPHNKDF